MKFKNRTSVKILGTFFALSLLTQGVVARAYEIEPVDTTNIVTKDFVVGPGKVELQINPGESRTAEIRVSNRLGREATFMIEVEDFTGSQSFEETVVLLGAERGPYTLKDYLQVPEKTFQINDGERAVIPVTVSIPTDAEPGGRYGSVLISTVGQRTSGPETGAAVVTRLGVLFFVTVPGEVKKAGELKEFVVKNGQVMSEGPIDFRLVYQNTGSIHLNPYGEIRIKNLLGGEVGALTLDPWFALPGSQRLREASWNPQFLFGRYTAIASVNRGYDDIVDTMTYSFWVLPWKIMVAFFGAIIVLVFVLRFIVTRFEFKRKS